MSKAFDRILEIPHRSDIYLRRVSATDAQEVFNLINPPEQREHLRFQTWIKNTQSLDDVRKQVKDQVAATNRGHDMQYRIIEGTPGANQARMVGTVTLFSHNQFRDSAHLGYWLEQGSTGRGYAFDAASRLVAYAQDQWSICELNLGIDPANKPSEHLAAKLGAEPTGRPYRQQGPELLWRAIYE